MYKWRDVSVRDKYSLQEYPSFHEKSSSREALLSAVKKFIFGESNFLSIKKRLTVAKKPFSSTVGFLGLAMF